MADVFAVAEMLVAHARRFYGDEVGIVVYYGSHARGTASPTSDLDLYFVPDSRRAYPLGTQFVLDGLPYDFWPVSWTMIEEIAQARGERPFSVAAALVGQARLLYARSPADQARFEQAQADLAGLLGEEKRPFMHQRALAAFKQVAFEGTQLQRAVAGGDAASVEWSRWQLVNAAANSLALAAQRYFSKGWGANLPEVLALPNAPAGWQELVGGVLNAPKDTVLAFAEGLVAGVRQVLLAGQREVGERETAVSLFQDFYFFVFEYKNKVLAAFQRGDAMTARYAAAQLQQEISAMLNKVDAGFFGEPFNLLGEYGAGYGASGFPDLLAVAAQGDFAVLAERVQQLDNQMQVWLMAQGVALNVLADAEVLQRFLLQRLPPGTKPLP